jgi:hypothetical protein
MLRALRRIEKIVKALGPSDRFLGLDFIIHFVDSDGVVTSMLRLTKEGQEWIDDPAEIARAE